MPLKSLPDRIHDAFANDPTARAYADKYLDRIIDAIDTIMDRWRRTVGLLVLLIIVFFLFSGAKTTEVTLGPFKVTNLSGVLTVIPAAASYLVYELVVSADVLDTYERLRDFLIRVTYPTLYANELHFVLGSRTVQFYGSEDRLRRTQPGRANTLFENLGALHFIALVVGTTAFIVYAYVYLFGYSKAHTLVVAASAMFAVINLLRSCAFVADWDWNAPES